MLFHLFVGHTRLFAKLRAHINVFFHTNFVNKFSFIKTIFAIVLIFGKNFTLDERKVVREYILSKKYDIEIYELDGNQEIYDLYII